ncbi:MAG: dTMP kinase, partial [Deltaproteobacteria bacterium]|nr:dTMP kinase [Deltaproteobacteria bacterium]
LAGLASRLETHPKGFLLALEGLDGSGKSTQARLVRDTLLRRGLAVTSLREPTDATEWGRIIRGSAPGAARRAPREELELFLKDRAWDVGFNILPALEAGGTAVLDRYVLSSVSYQGALGIAPREILEASLGFPWPDLTVILDLGSPEKGLERIRTGRGAPDLSFENAPYLAKVREALALAADLPGVEFVDATIPERELAERISAMALEAMRLKASKNSC